MPDTREKLIELLDEVSEKLKDLCGGYNDGTGNAVRADHLIANGVTFAPFCLIVPKLTEEELKLVAEQLRNAKPMILVNDQKPQIEVINQQWIPVTERKPTKEDAKVIDGYIIAIMKGRKPNLMKWSEVASYPHYLTHWMPLPQPPNEVSK